MKKLQKLLLIVLMWRHCLLKSKTRVPSTRIGFCLKKQLFVADTASVHTNPMKTFTENATFWKRSPEWNFLKTPFSCFRVDGGKRNFSKTMTYQFWIPSTRAKENGGIWWFYVSTLHKVAREYARMPIAREKQVYWSFLLEIDTAQQTDPNQHFPSLQFCTRWWF